MVQDHMTLMFMSEFKFSINAQFLRETKIIINRRLRRVLRDLCNNFVPYNFIHAHTSVHMFYSHCVCRIQHDSVLVCQPFWQTAPSCYRHIDLLINLLKLLKMAAFRGDTCVSLIFTIFRWRHFCSTTFGQAESGEQVLMTLVSLWQLSEQR